MKKLLAAFALFSLFFGAGNLILPPYLGVQAGADWALVAFGFVISAVLIPILGIFAHAKLQGTIYDFGAPLGKGFSLTYAALIYGIALALPAPRTASVTHEMAIMPFVDSPYWLTSLVYFSLVLLAALNRSKLLDLFGKITTPAILVVLTALIGMAFLAPEVALDPTTMENPFGSSLLEGYQTFDAIAAVVIGGVLLVSIQKMQAKGKATPRNAAQAPNVNQAQPDNNPYHQQKSTVRFAAVFSAIALSAIYVGLIYAGAQAQGNFDAASSRSVILQGVAQLFLGNTAPLGLGILVALACFTTATGIVTGTADFVASYFEGPGHAPGTAKKVFVGVAIAGAILGVLMGQFPVVYIIAIAVPALVFIYPTTIILMALHVLPASWATPKAFKATVICCFVVNTPSFLDSLGYSALQEATTWMPLSAQGLAWVLPVILSVVGLKIFGVFLIKK
jgi:LIVCS family branched-chain amino acid:cation transporter